MYDSKSFAKVLLEFAREILKDIGEGQPSDAQLRTLDAISLVLDKQLHRNGENTLITELELLGMFNVGLEESKNDLEKLNQKLSEMANTVRLGLEIAAEQMSNE